jgi:hypothetical protein
MLAELVEEMLIWDRRVVLGWPRQVYLLQSVE